MKTQILIWNFFMQFMEKLLNNSLLSWVVVAIFLLIVAGILIYVRNKIQRRRHFASDYSKPSRRKAMRHEEVEIGHERDYIESRLLRGIRINRVLAIIALLTLLCAGLSFCILHNSNEAKSEMRKMISSNSKTEELLKEVKDQVNLMNAKMDSAISISNSNASKIDSLIQINNVQNQKLAYYGNEIVKMKKAISNCSAKVDSLEKGMKVISVEMNSLYQKIEKCCDSNVSSEVVEDIQVKTFSIEIYRQSLSRNEKKVLSPASRISASEIPVCIIPGKGFVEMHSEDNFHNTVSNELSFEMDLNKKDYSFSLIENSEKITVLNKGEMLLGAGGLPVNLDLLEFFKTIQIREAPKKNTGIIQVITGGVAIAVGASGTIYYACNPELTLTVRKNGEDFAEFEYSGYAIPFFATMAGGGVCLLTRGIVNIRGSLNNITITGRFN